MAADFTTGVWVEVVAIVGVDTFGVKFTDVWHWGGRYGLGNYPYFVPSFGGHSGSSFLFIHLAS